MGCRLSASVNHLSFWLRTAAGGSLSDEFNPFTRFGFAAFGNNIIDYQASRRYRNIFAFPGLGFDAGRFIIARSFAKGTAELVLPPIRFRHLGSLNFYSNWMQFTVFSSAITTSEPDFGKNRFMNVGTQLDIKLVIFSLLESTLSVGYAQAFDLLGNDKFEEWMISLKLLK